MGDGSGLDFFLVTAVKNKFFKCAEALVKGGADVEAGVRILKSFVNFIFFFVLELMSSEFFATPFYIYANCVYFVTVATEFFTNWNAIEGWGRGDFRTVSHKEMTRITIHCSYPYMNGMLSTVIDMSFFQGYKSSILSFSGTSSS